MRYAVLFTLAVLAACDTPSPDFRGVPAHRVSMGGSDFDIRIKGLHAEAIRTNVQWAPRMAATAPQGLAAIEAVSGCRVDKLTGDQAMMQARLDCGDGPPPGPRFPQEWECEAYEIDTGYGALDCRPYP
ncbi:hypothetical protein [uncultured Roseovarius sp.]|uniref:hypothetical protein n=1 Tax=uncultured Roseovarius sp. TaxID=293344 RepID=UPI0025FBF6C6|nr:hypothetical protein [uncultured Roseovarius sp.]